MALFESAKYANASCSMLLSILFLSLALLRVWSLRRAPVVVISGFLGRVKMLLFSLLILSSIGRFVALGDLTPNSSYVRVSQGLEVTAVLVLSVLSLIEHWRSIQPSGIITLYLTACIIRDVLEVSRKSQGQRSWLMQDPILAQITLEAALLATENLQKELTKEYSGHYVSSEEKSGFFGRIFFWWINPVLVEGYQNVLLNTSLPSIDTKLLSKPIRTAAIRAWEQRLRPESRMTLPKVLFVSLKRPFLLAIPPRLFLTLFRYSQPIIIRQSIQYVTSNKPSNQTWTAHSLITAAVVVYVGLAISTTVYQSHLNKLRVMIRAALIALIHDKTMNSYAESVSEGKVLTLTSTDVDNLDTIGEMFHETWGQIFEVAIGIAMLSWEVGWVSPVPLFIIFLCSRVSQYVARNLRSRQGGWNEATQNRISMTSAAISAIKNVKMLGLQDVISERIQGLRQTELYMASRVRWMMVAYNASANANGMFAPVITLVLYAILAKLRGDQLDTETAFTTIAILSMVTHPANMVMTIVPRVIASFSSFERIQSFLLEPSRQDYRIEIVNSQATPRLNNSRDDDFHPASHPSFSVVGVSVGGSRSVLSGINLTVQKGSIVICSGATAAGKTTLVRALLGETPSVGTIAVSSKCIGYCSQLPWLPNGTVKQVITGFEDCSSVADARWYETVIAACCLSKDIGALPSGDETIVGSRGANLSGGQRQRLALARAIFSRSEILVLDDPFSALDGSTEHQIIENLFGSDGLLRKLEITVIWVSNSTQHFRLADEVVILEGGRIKEQGKWNELLSRDPQVLKIVLNEDNIHENKNTPVDNPNPISRQQRSYKDIAIDSKRKTGDSALYSYYLKAAGIGNFAFMVTCTASCSFFVTFPQYWLKLWTDSRSSNEWIFIGGYIALYLIAWISTNGIMWSTIILVAPHSGLVLHSKLLRIITRAPLLYFSKTDSGSILNRFSQDIQLVDKQLASALSSLFVQIFKLLTQVILLFVVQKLLTLTLPICLITVYLVQKIYLRTSRQLRLLELESRSAVLIDFLEAVEGLPTIRAFAGQSRAENKHLKNLDESQKPFYLLLCLQCWLRIVLDLLVAGIAVGVITLAVALRDTTSGGQVGVALNIVLIANTTLLRLVESWTNLEISLGAIARIKTLEEEVSPEDQPCETKIPPETWPSSGPVEIQALTAAYNEETTALKDVSLQIRPGQKVVVCGRTGSGKSSLLLALLKLLDTKSGSIIVDGINIGQVPRSAIRERCFVTVPQEPLLLNQQTLRFNVDPTETLSNDTITEALSKTRLWHHFNSTPSTDRLHDTHSSAHPILDQTLASLPSLSVGQGQLLALARALLQVYTINTSGAKPIILLDEATSSLDSSTEKLILDIVHEELTCNGYTVIMVAHRVGAAVAHLRKGVDVVVWMKDGRIEKIGDADEIANIIAQAITPDALGEGGEESK
ncbi:P-loop containing nucleoside triphosphate hydrolase protein [Daldinia vernicosa]|uniref:P-loop containing nucleoside triphosphate hydrolase protein n=1 Tax=Daldinia vernicosa TaxID=114800 RepID=UPI00200827BE|nr:P-loop containing nucleoside triphosphate hydrolase protein [Daldinia vernicosa]KAI0846774.1 P-loop containing nucleoside triphosphate hydrolase protein [Daldinia vernicosa]